MARINITTDESSNSNTDLTIDQFKAAMGRLPTGVSIISTNIGEQLYGFTASSFTSLSLDPMLVLFCLSKKVSSAAAFSLSTKFAISVLAEDQEAISHHFAKPHIDKFLYQPYKLTERTECPVILGAITWIECNKVSEYDGGDHIIFTGEVIAIHINNSKNPLIYFSKDYRKLQ